MKFGRLLLLLLVCLLLGAVASCGTGRGSGGGGGSSSADDDDSASGDDDDSASTADDDDDADDDDATATFCGSHGWAERAFSAGPYGIHRHDIAADFELELIDGSDWGFLDEWTGCESYVFLTDEKRVSALDSTSLWESEEDLVALTEGSPDNVHYFFVTSRSEDTAADDVADMQDRVESVLSQLDDGRAAWWTETT
jgi:hypothetical protein